MAGLNNPPRQAWGLNKFGLVGHSSPRNASPKQEAPPYNINKNNLHYESFDGSAALTTGSARGRQAQDVPHPTILQYYKIERDPPGGKKETLGDAQG